MLIYFKAIFLIFVITLISAAQNKVINIPDDYLKIQDAINASENGDTIIVSPGTYYENLNFRGKEIVISSHFIYNKDRSFISSTILDGSNPLNEDSSSVVVFVNGETNNTVLTGFTITGGNGTKTFNTAEETYFRTGGGILIDHSSPVISNNIITKNQSTNKSDVNGAGGGGIRAGQSKAIISNNIISHNKGGYAGGVMLAYCAGLVFRNNLIVNNEAASDFDGGGGVYIDWESVSIINCTIINNTSGGTGGGLILTGTNDMEIMNCIIYNNSANSTANKQIFHRSFGSSKISFSNVQGGADGFRNINEEPVYQDTINYYLTVASPGIDKGNFLPKYYDKKNVLDDEAPLYPALGTLINDQGWQGGNPHMIMSSNILNTTINKSYFNPSGDILRINIKSSLPGESINQVEAYVMNNEDIINVISLEDEDNDGIHTGEWFINDTEKDFNILISAYLVNASHYIADENGIGISTKGPLKIESLLYTSVDTIPNPGDKIEIDINLKNYGNSATITSISAKFNKLDGNYINIENTRPSREITFDDIPAGEISSTTLNLIVDSDSPVDKIQYVEAVFSSNDTPIWYDTLAIEVKPEVTGIEESALDLPNEYKLDQNYPNPFNPSTVINFNLAGKGFVSLKVYDILGREVKTLVNKYMNAGSYKVEFDANNLPSGVYFYTLSAGNYLETQKMILLR